MLLKGQNQDQGVFGVMEDITYVEDTGANSWRRVPSGELLGGSAKDSEDTGVELRDYRSPPVPASWGGYSAGHNKELPNRVNSTKINPPQKQEPVTFSCEQPSLLQEWSSNSNCLSRGDFILGAITLVVIDDYVESMTGQQYMESFHPEIGAKLVEAIITALDSPEYISGSFEGTNFTMTEVSIPTTLACWSPLFENAVIVLKPAEVFPSRGGLLKLFFGALLQLAAVEYPVMVESGLVLVGYSTVLVPIEISFSGQILWHLEVSSGSQPLYKSELQATQGSWLQKQTLEELQTTEALLGWCGSARVDLGTERLDAGTVRWSIATIKPTTWCWKGANLQLLDQSAAPIQIGTQLGLSWEHVINTVRFTPGGNYTGCLASSMLEHVIHPV
ncbi:hypothetical protein BDV26DRAFT_296540 [Aspergillus bertholletiae]|uniref:Uncharacterized protein n=1 Tax=Aspergillus bertholletiae TaxID=1226010 RepID=A0A5N7AVJ4_9EURO|nr:hypothetical protein BDV26DRAFT_296540 [Aspergillus bertholletiae]